MNAKKCPKCGLNYITDNGELCTVCREGLAVKAAKNLSERVYDETFIFTNEPAKLEGEKGFKAYNSKGVSVGIVFMTKNPKISAYGHCELCFYPEIEFITEHIIG